MRGRETRQLTRPAFVPSLLVSLATRVLPGGTRRNRYRQEFQAELYGMTAVRQTAHALGILASSWSLRSATTDPRREGRSMLTILRTKPLLCLLNVRHRWEAAEHSRRRPLSALHQVRQGSHGVSLGSEADGVKDSASCSRRFPHRNLRRTDRTPSSSQRHRRPRHRRKRDVEFMVDQARRLVRLQTDTFGVRQRVRRVHVVVMQTLGAAD